MDSVLGSSLGGCVFLRVFLSRQSVHSVVPSFCENWVIKEEVLCGLLHHSSSTSANIRYWLVAEGKCCECRCVIAIPPVPVHVLLKVLIHLHGLFMSDGRIMIAILKHGKMLYLSVLLSKHEQGVQCTVAMKCRVVS